MILDLDQIPAFQRLREKKFLGQPLIDRIKIKNITLEKEKLNVDISILGWDEPAPPYHELDTELIDENDRQEEGEQIDENLIRIERNHQRFYDKLRERIRIFIQEKGGEKADQSLRYLLVAPDLFVLLARLLKDPRVPLKSKSIVTAAIAYFITPVDIIPEFLTGPAGYLDDIVLAVLALKSILLDVDRRILEDHWNGEESLLSVIQDIVHRANDLVGSRTVSLIKKVLKK
ncbi:MAG: DUF1232 domain-containing protein [Bacillaceae bacterium]|nr:DUF1232 domain-containing protein [Bacillaceae bacterium]